MKVSQVIGGVVMVLFLILPVYSQGHAGHHPEMGQETRKDTAATPGMHGGMMGGQGMMHGGMMGGQGMMHGGMMGGQGMMQRCMHGKMMQGRMMQGGMMMSGAGMGGHHGAFGRFFHVIQHLPQMEGQLNLSSEQEDRLKTLRAEFLKRKADWEADITKGQIDLSRLLDKRASASEIQKQLRSIKDVEVALQVAAYKTARQMLEVLTEDQKTQLGKTCPMCGGKSGMMPMMEGGSIHSEQ